MSRIPSIGSIPKTSITKILNDQTALCSSDPERFIKAISYVVRIYYGLNVDTEKDQSKKAELAEVFAVFRNTVFTKYPKMTFEQFNLIHSESVIEKRQGISLTVDELINPIASYYVKIQFVLNERNVILKQEQEKAEIEQKKEAHKKESIELYLECVKTDGIWKGEFYHASTFAEEQFKDRFSDDEKKEIYHEAWYKVKELEAQQKLAHIDSVAFNTPVPTNYQMFCQYLTTRACQKGMPIILE